VPVPQQLEMDKMQFEGQLVLGGNAR
jgi:hypothetical protein